MSPTSAGVAAGKSAAAVESRAKSKKLRLYEKCLEKPPGTQFNVADLQATGVPEDLEELQSLTDQLVDFYAFQLLKTPDGEAIWRTRSQEQAKTLRELSPHERMVYERVESAHTDGIWQRAIQARLNMHQTVCTRIIKDLKKKHLIKEFTGNRVAGMAKKMLILSYLEPSDDNTGGAFYSDGELDVGLVEAVSYSVVRFVEKMSWAEQPGASSHKKRKREDDTQAPGAGISAVDHSSKKIRSTEGAVPTSEGPIPQTQRHHDQEPTSDPPRYKPHLSASSLKPLIPHSPDYAAYPTTAEICAHVRDIGVLTKALSLKFKDSDFESVLEMLAYDGRIERVTGGGGGVGPPEEDVVRWRSVRKSFEEWTGPPTWPAFAPQREGKGGVGNGVSEAPCGRCPVFELCTPGGPVNPEECKYFDEWLDMF